MMCGLTKLGLLSLLMLVVHVGVVYTFILQDFDHLTHQNASTQDAVERMKQDIRNQKDAADRIINLSVYGNASGQMYSRLADFVDKYGARLSGSQNLENSIEYIMLKMKEDGLENVHGENVKVPHWVRGGESAYMIKPRNKHLSMLGLGGSVATPATGITAEVLVVNSFEELEQRKHEAPGKIIVYNQEWVSYGVTVAYRYNGASRAAAVGGVAALVRSVTPFSINSPHTGIQRYNESLPQVPTACITAEDAAMMRRISQRARTLPDTISRNVVSEIIGSEHPEQVVLISGHIDSWDVGQGAMDDGAGALLGWQAISLLRHLGLRPKRTIRSVMWTAEEVGGVGSRQYYENHKADIDNYVFVLESDMGTFKPRGIFFGGNNASIAMIQEVMDLLKSINAAGLTSTSVDRFLGGDISPWVRRGVPGATLDTHNDKYFYFHHTEGDTMDVLDTHELDLCSALWTVVAYTIANTEDMLPKDLNVQET